LGCNSGGNVITGNDNIIFGNVATNVGFTDATSNVIIFATGGNRRIDLANTANIFIGTNANVVFTSSALTINGTAVGGGGGSSDTLANVTARGNVTTDTITLSNTGNSLIASGTITSNILISRVNPRFFSEVSNANLIVNISLFDQYNLTALATNLTINSSTLGNPENGNKIVLRLKDDGNVRNITWSSTTPGGFRGVGVTLPANTSPVANVFYIGCIYNSEDTLWDVIAVSK
jgi:hypothetical protein